jgi:hypothetical protein
MQPLKVQLQTTAHTRITEQNKKHQAAQELHTHPPIVHDTIYIKFKNIKYQTKYCLKYIHQL